MESNSIAFTKTSLAKSFLSIQTLIKPPTLETDVIAEEAFNISSLASDTTSGKGRLIALTTLKIGIEISPNSGFLGSSTTIPISCSYFN